MPKSTLCVSDPVFLTYLNFVGGGVFSKMVSRSLKEKSWELFPNVRGIHWTFMKLYEAFKKVRWATNATQFRKVRKWIDILM